MAAVIPMASCAKETKPADSAKQAVRFHLSLNVADLNRAVDFFRVFFNAEPAKCRADYAKFELNDPPLVMSLEPFKTQPGGTLNHLGFRMPDSAALVEVQRRLELAGINTRREEGVECCYARQTKFWVHDPDGNMWEVYTLDEDLEHRGEGRIPTVPVSENHPNGPPPAIWTHSLGTKFPQRLPILDGTVDRVMLQGTFNERLSQQDEACIGSELQRILKPGGLVHLHMLTTDAPLGDAPIRLPGPAAAVQFVPVLHDVLNVFTAAGFAKVEVAFRAQNACFSVGDCQLRETRIEATR